MVGRARIKSNDKESKVYRQEILLKNECDIVRVLYLIKHVFWNYVQQPRPGVA